MTYGSWTWPHRFFRRRADLRNPELETLSALGLSLAPGRTIPLSAVSVPIWFNTPEDVAAIARERGDAALFRWTGWRCVPYAQDPRTMVSEYGWLLPAATGALAIENLGEPGARGRVELDLAVGFAEKKLRGAATLTLESASRRLVLDTRDLTVMRVNGSASGFTVGEKDKFLGAPLTIGRDVTIGHQVMLHGCMIGDTSLIGIKATVLNHAVVPRHCLVGAHALVTERKTFEENSLITGAPARAIRTLEEPQRQMFQFSAAHYVEISAVYRAEGWGNR